MTTTTSWLRRQLAGVIAVAVVVIGYFVVSLPATADAELDRMASRYAFTPMSIAMPAAATQQNIRKVNQDYEHIRAWISSVGAAVAMNDLDGDGLSNDLCLVDPRSDQIVLTPTPGARADRYAPFALDPAPLPMNDVLAPMGCVPADFNEDGRLDLLVYYWGRTSILYLAKPGATRLDASAYQPTELAPGPNSTGGRYTGPQWNTNTATVADFDGDGHQDIFIGNYFPDGPVLDDKASTGVEMNHSMSHAQNSGQKLLFRWTGTAAGAPTYQGRDDVFPEEARTGWSLASSATDLDGDLLPELYVANDFGPDRLLYNQSTPGRLQFRSTIGAHTPGVPKSKRLGNDSFKGMGVDFGDLGHNGLYDMFVSNITTSFGIQESNFHFSPTARDQAELRARLNDGEAPYTDRSGETGTAWSGWGWDVKIDDFDNSGDPVIAQATGFVKGGVNRWPQLQELATANDALLDNPLWWPKVESGDDIAGNQTLHFFVKGSDGRYTDLAPRLGLAVPVPTRGIGTGDSDGDGRLDFAVARQWEAPVFYHNESPSPGAFLGLRLTYDSPAAAGPLPATGSPVIGAEVTVTTADGRKHIGRVDGGSGHSGKRSHEVHIGLGDQASGPVQVRLQWRDRTGQARQSDLRMSPGWHSLQLGSQANER
ncbi:CRTAC1 family protein [Amycolatopsis anabasis]|uniref:CRTAC1 family protein n=1 Tax=Amycolatopsis anabasis TaxID=1840409 RepID=UPI00131B96B5|nr:CRTAC1 family protein [Amycolatopsis anabasis]